MKNIINLRFWEEVVNEETGTHKHMYYDINSMMKNPSIIPEQLLRNEDPHITTMLGTGKLDMNGKEIFEGDYIEVINSIGISLLVECCYGTVERYVVGLDGSSTECLIQGFYYKILRTGNKTFPIKENYKGVTDYEIFDVIGNKYETPELSIWD